MRNLTLLFLSRLRALAHLRSDLREKSIFQTLFIAAFSIALIAGLWSLFHNAFIFLDRLGGIGLIIIPRLFAFFFFALIVMLVFSGLLTTYTTLYRSDEIPYLLMHPFSLSEIVTFKAIESAFYASWAFFFVMLPFVGAYVRYENLPWHIIGLALLYALPFAFLCALTGTLLMILLVRYLPRNRITWTLLALLLASTLIVLWTKRPIHDTSAEQTIFLINRFIPFLSLSANPLLPSWWIAEGILSVTRQNWSRALLFFLLLLSNMLLALVLIESIGRRLFYSGWQQTLAGSRTARRKKVTLEKIENACPFIPPDIRALIFKDARLFLRDPRQWMQALFFFGLLAVYFLSLRNMHYRDLPDIWKNTITFLNIFSIACVLCSLSSRFIYPQMSLEGQAFWIIGMAPTTMGRILLSKFLAAFFFMLVVSSGLMLVSTHMLDIAPETRRIAMIQAACLSCAIAGLSTANGALFIDLKQRNPSAIVSSFGGTLNLVIILLFMLLCILPPAALFHYRERGLIPQPYHARAMQLLIASLITLTLASVTIPLALARRSLNRRDY